MRLLRIGAVLAVLIAGGWSSEASLSVRFVHPVAGMGFRPCGTQEAPSTQWKHVIWIWMENASYGEIIGNRSAPYLNRLASACGLATNYLAITHPSLPNYVAATSGSDWGISDDNPPSSHPLAHASIFGQLAAAGMTWRSYEESMPSNCATSSAGRYAVKHNPAAYYVDIRARCARWDVPMGTTSSGAFISDLRRDTVPSFAFVTPNLCDDMHDCSTATGDAWLKRWITRIVAGPGYRSGTTVIFVTFDEGSSNSNQVATIVVSPTTPPGTKSPTALSHYSLLKTTEQLLGIPTSLAHAGDPSTESMRSAFHL